MSSSSENSWYFDLVEYNISKESSTEYAAKVRCGSTKYIKDIAARIAEERSDLREETIATCLTLGDQAIQDFVCEGHVVVTGSATYMPTIGGTFADRSGSFDDDENELRIAVNITGAFRKLLSNITAVFSGNVKDAGGATIANVYDTYTGTNDGTITPGNTIVITGTKIKCVDAEGATGGSVQFVNNETNEVAATVTLFANNAPSKVIIIVPELAAGSYTLQIKTYYSSANVQLNEERTIEYALTLTVK